MINIQKSIELTVFAKYRVHHHSLVATTRWAGYNLFFDGIYVLKKIPHVK